MPLQLFDLLDKGYFPKELPPPFTTAQFAHATAGSGAVVPVDACSNGDKWSMLCVHNLVRAGGLRRNLGIPNPKHWFLLAEHVVANWTQLIACTNASPFSLTKPVEVQSRRAISSEHDMAERTVRLAELRSTRGFILKADISRFFPSIYTHSIPWAIMGKDQAKEAHFNGNLRRTWEDKTDQLSRNLNAQQTVGIPIGPDTSLLLAEVLLSRIDVDMIKRFPKLKGIRYVDDYEFALDSRSEAEEVLGFLQHLLNEFELALNPHKTRIVPLPDRFDPPWTSSVRVFHFRSGGPGRQKSDLIAYFDMIFDYLKQFPDEGLLKYAIARLRTEDIYRENWPLIENIFIQCCLVEPGCIPQVTEQLLYYRSKRFPTTKQKWSDCLNKITYDRLPLGQTSEVAWAMLLMKQLKIRLLGKNAKLVGACEDSVVGLMGLDLMVSGLTKSAPLDALMYWFSGNWTYTSFS